MPRIETKIPSVAEIDSLRFDGLVFDVAAVGDFNGDGFNDFVITDPTARASYTYTYTYTVDAYARVPDGTGLYTKTGPGLYNYSENGNYTAATRTETAVGQTSYSGAGGAAVIFGNADGLPGDLDLANLDPSEGFLISAVSSQFEYLGEAVAGIGDINGDGHSDILFGQPYGRGNVYTNFDPEPTYYNVGEGFGSYTYCTGARL